MSDHDPQARVVYDYPEDRLVGTVLATGETFATDDPRRMAEWLFAAGARHGRVLMPDWREGDISPPKGDKIALNYRLVQLGMDESARRKIEGIKPRSPWKTRYFVDTEFTSFENCQLISIGIVGEDGREFYAERTDFDQSACSDFVKSSVLRKLGQFPGRAMPFAQLRIELREWLEAIPTKPKPVLSYDYHGDYDLVELAIGGRLPAGWSHENVSGKLDAERLAAFVAEHAGEHHALFDARANALAFR
jgi:hypothetical protein